MERWERVKSLVDDALALDESRRAEFLDDACRGEPTIRAEVESLLRYESGALLESDPGDRRELSGSQLGHYRVFDEIGRGGMGRVFRALDTRLDRLVAIKVLPEEFAENPERLRRFEREARLVAALSHPAIATIHGLEHWEGAPFLVLELVEGPTLAERLERGPIETSEALELARRIAEALEAAHEQGVVHRDLKPSNVKLTGEGEVKVLDFGLAKALRGTSDSGPRSPDAADAPEPPTTREGLLLGTPPYMSPEQVGGARVDHRTDVWSFGVVLYEMLVGQRPFTGATTAEVLGAVLRDEPDWGRLPGDTPRSVRRLLRRCLTRDRKRRLQWIGEARVTLEGTPDADEPDAPPREPGHGRPRLGLVALLLGAGLVAGWLAVGARKTAPALATLRVRVSPPPGGQIMPAAGFDLSPRGDQLAFVARSSDGVLALWVRPLDGEPRQLEGTAGVEAPFWAPDGRALAFFAEGKLKRVPASGGSVRTLADGASAPRGGAWRADGTIVYAPISRGGLVRVPETGGTPTPVTELRGDEVSHRWPRALPDGRLLLLVQTAEPGAPDDRSRLEILEADGNRRELMAANSSAALVGRDSLLFGRSRRLYRQAVEPATLAPRGEPRLVLDDIGINVNEWATFAASESLLVHAETLEPPRLFEWRSRDGGRTRLEVPPGLYHEPSLSPDGQRVAYVDSFSSIWVLDLQRGTQTRLTFEAVDHYQPAWSPDGAWIGYGADAAEGRGGRLFRQPASGLGERELLYSTEGLLNSADWSPDGRWLAVEEDGDIVAIDVSTGERRVAVATAAIDAKPRFSPDGRWLAYASAESGRWEVYAVRFPGLERRWQVSTAGGLEPCWGPNGEELLFRTLGGAVFRTRVSPEASPEFGIPVALPGLRELGVFGYDVDAGGRVLALVEDRDRVPGLGLIQGWRGLPDSPRR